MTAKISKDTADKLKSAQLANALKKVQSGRTLTNREQRLIDENTDDSKQEIIYDSIAAAAASMKLSKEALKKAKKDGCPGFRNSRVYDSEVRVWLSENPPNSINKDSDYSLKDQRLIEQIRKDRLSNDLRSGKLVELSWVHERFQRMGGEVHAIRARSEAEDPVKFAATAGDVALCRSIMRGIWDDVLTQLQDCGKHFEK